MSNEILAATLVKAASGATGASIISLFWRPRAMAKLALWLSGVVTGAVGAVFAIMITGFAVEHFGMDTQNVFTRRCRLDGQFYGQPGGQGYQASC